MNPPRQQWLSAMGGHCSNASWSTTSGAEQFDVSVLELRGNNIYEVVSTGGDTFLGGVDFDLRLLNLLIEKFEAKYGRELSDDPALIQRFLDAAEKAKMALSELTSHRVQIPSVSLGAIAWWSSIPP